MVLYVDASALAKAFTKEAEWPALRAFLRGRELASSAIVRTEITRVALRLNHPPTARAAPRLLRRVQLIGIDDAILIAAAALQPPTLRPLDAIHLASALLLGPDLEAVVTYDTRMAEAAGWLGIDAVAPS